MSSIRKTIGPRLTGALSVTAVGTTVTLSWPQATEAVGAVTYTVTRVPAFASPVTTSATTYVDTTASGNPQYSVTATDSRGLTSSPALTGGAVIAPPQNGVMSTRFAGLSWVQVEDFGQDKDYRLDGTDTQTGQVFTAALPRIWNSSWGPASLTLQKICGAGRLQTPDQLFTRTFTTVDGLSCLGITRNFDPYVPVDQASMRLKTAAPFASQGMIVNRGKIKIPADLDVSTGSFLVLTESKYNYTDKKVELALYYEPGVWYYKFSTVRLNSGALPWGNASGPYVNSVPAPFSSGFNGNEYGFYRTTTDPRGKWLTFVMGCRLQDSAGVVAGNGAQGWAYAAVGQGTTTAPVDFSACTQEFYVPGFNMADAADPGLTINFPLLHYSNFNCAGRPFYWTDIEIHDQWPSGSPSRPAGAV